MINQRQKQQMKDYVVAKLEGSSDSIRPIEKEILSGITSNYVLIDKNGAVILVDRPYPNDGLQKLAEVFRDPKNGITNIAYLVFKDGKTFFRNASHGEEAGLTGVKYKSDKGFSLKDYSPEKVRRMITFRPEEKYIRRRNMEDNGDFGWVQYYQPDSEGLDEAIESFRFENVTFNLDHIDSSARFGPIYRDSEKLFMWDDKQRRHNPGQVELKGRYLQPRA
jgi:hypothetical protein